ncbi:MAG: hypothetical protein ABEL76_06190 [Bradymonadaceae bacterium]
MNSSPGTRSAWDWTAALAVVLAGPLLLGIHFLWLTSDVSPSEWRKPARYLENELGANDAIVVEPHWNEDPLPHLSDVGSQVRRQKRVLPADLQGVERLWLLSEADRVDRGLERLPFEAGAPDGRSFGDVVVRSLDVPDWLQFEYAFSDHLASADVAHVDSDGEVALDCRQWDGDQNRWPCGERDQFVWVGRTMLMVGGDPHHCIWAHPPPQGRTLRIRFPDVPLDAALRLRAGLSFEASLSKRGTPVELSIAVDGERRLSRTFAPKKTSWPAMRVDTSGSTGRRADVTVRVRSEKVFERYFCFDGWVLDETSARRLSGKR